MWLLGVVGVPTNSKVKGRLVPVKQGLGQCFHTTRDFQRITSAVILIVSESGFIAADESSVGVDLLGLADSSLGGPSQTRHRLLVVDSWYGLAATEL